MKQTKKQGSKLISMTLAAAMVLAPVPALAASSDIRGHWAEDVIYEWEATGLISGYKDGTFRPNKAITRAEFTRILNQALDLKTKGSVSFSDVTSSKWYYNDVAIAVGEKYTAGFPDNTFRPNATITRAEAAVFVSKAAVLSGGSMGYFSDAASIPSWARGAVGAMVENGYMSGYKNGSFQPNGSLTRAEAVSTLNRVMTNGLDEEAIREKDRVITKDGTTLKNETIAGNLIISKEVGEGEVHLEKVKIQGDLIIRGGGEHSVYLKDTTVEGNTVMDKEDVRVEISGKTILPRIEIWRTCNLQGEEFKGKISKILITDRISDFITMNIPAKSLVVEERSNVEVKQPIDSIQVTRSGAGSKIEVDKNITVPLVVADGRVDLSGKGTVTLLEANVSGSTYTNSITVKETETPKNVKPPLSADEIYVDRIRIKGTDDLSTISVKGGTLQMIAEVLPSDAKNKEVTWSVKDRSGKATISASGLLTAVENGTVTVKATAKDANEAYGEKDISISNQIDGVVHTRAIAGVTPPVRGAVPVTTIPETTEYTGTVTWAPALATGGVFAPETVYTATVTLSPKTGYTLTGVTENYFTVAGGAATNPVNSGAVKVVFPATGQGDAVMKTADIQGVTIPVKGATPVTTIVETAEYTGTVAWKDNPTVFEADKAYTAVITLTPKMGYTSMGVAQNFFKVAGATTTNAANGNVITAVFAKAKIPVDKLSIPMRAPATGEEPVGTIVDTTQYTGTVQWDIKADPEVRTVPWNQKFEHFLSDKVYVATITLTPKDGYSFQGVGEDVFKISSASSVKHVANSGVIVAEFPRTVAGEKVQVARNTITEITIPVRDAKPSVKEIGPKQYTGTVTWSPALTADGTFAANVAYTAKIEITVADGYTLDGLAANYFDVVGATTTFAVTPDTNNTKGVITAVYPPTQMKDTEITTIALTGVTAPIPGEKPNTEVASGMGYRATLQWPEGVVEFQANQYYTATVQIKPEEGYSIATLEQSGISIDIQGARVSYVKGSGEIMIYFPMTKNTPITAGEILGIATPVLSGTPTKGPLTSDTYTATITWEQLTNPGVPISETQFLGATTYVAVISITPKKGFTLEGLGSTSFTVQGATAVFSPETGEVRVTFPKTAAGKVAIKSNVLSGISVPTVGGTPTANVATGKSARSTVGTFGDTPQYTATIFWNGNPNRFEKNMIYTARIEIKAKKGFSLSGISKDFFQVPGAKSVKTIPGNATSCVVEVVFPVTGE